MNINKFFSIFVIFLFFLSCSKKIEVEEALKERSLDLQMIEAYEQGMSHLRVAMYYLQQKNLMKLKYYTHNQYGHLGQL